ncbi:HdaA/DnaA family protein [Croceicoccus sediminis]|uniref:HdaA/DnaA family protein n=1 Tax=Croceicoccus sediminis TaxID=2571150 RepID=UPI00118399B2|nr:ATPase [Croceicoccus sediminis]
MARPVQIVLPLTGVLKEQTVVVGNANEGFLRACEDAAHWPFRTAILSGPPRSGKSLLARWFGGIGTAIDDAEDVAEDELFHAWNRAQESGRPLLLIGRPVPSAWKITLPDLGSRLGAALHLSIDAPDDDMLARLIEAHAAQRGLALGEGATTYLVPRVERSFAAVEALVAEIDRLSLERKVPARQAIWREALERLAGRGDSPEQGDLF